MSTVDACVRWRQHRELISVMHLVVPDAVAPVASMRRFRFMRKLPVVYFLRDESGRVKIGRSTLGGLRRRIAELQIGNAETLELCHLVAGSEELERELHDHFADAHLGGEWFRAVPELMGLL